MTTRLFQILLLAAISAPGTTAIAAQVSFEALRDNTIYGEATGNSNGQGDHFIAGKSGISVGLRRALIAFDVSALPVPIRVDRVALELKFQGTTLQETQARVVSIHRLLADWGEGTSDPGPGGVSGAGNGASATPNDATWNYRVFNTQTWSSYNPAISGSGGGDFVSQPSAMATVGIVPGVAVIWETLRGANPNGLVADIEQWLADPSSNHGWLLKTADESTTRTARRFYSKDDATAAFHPRLVVDYAVVPEPSTFLLAILVLGSLVSCRLRHRALA